MEKNNEKNYEKKTEKQIIASTYEIIGKIGHGGGGNVYLANHLRLGKKVVLKADRRKITAKKELLRREVDVLKELSHTYIPQVYDFFVENDTVYTVIDYVEGESLDKPLNRGERFSQPQVIKWAKQILEALCYLHSPIHGDPPRGYVHSDIKPANIMRTPDNNICLIDFNIALALGETTVIGRSPGYASPEHYGLDFSSDPYTSGSFADKDTVSDDTKDSDLTEADDSGDTEREEDSTVAEQTDKTVAEKTVTPKTKMIVPDVRSDIYSLGATLYHLLSGVRPARNAKEVVPLSPEEFSPQVAAIITKAMNPNPNLRYQTAEEMLQAFRQLRTADPRVLALKRQRKIIGVLLAALFAIGVSASFIGLKRMQTTENWLRLAEYARNALEDGDTSVAVSYAMEAFPEGKSILRPDYLAEPQRALTEALGVYDLSDGYKTHETMELSAAPLYMAIGPDGRTAASMTKDELTVFDTDSMEVLASLPTEGSALSEAEYLDSSRIVYAGAEGICVYDIEQKEKLWSGSRATGICVSGDGRTVAGVYRDESQAVIYDAETGAVKYTADFSGKHQQVTVNDIFANPNDNLLALNYDGTLLGVSFADGSLKVFNLEDQEGDIEIFDAGSGYVHFEGGFYQQYFAFSASREGESVFAVIDTDTVEQTGGFQSETLFSVQTDTSGIYVQTGNILVGLDPVSGEQKPLVTTPENIRVWARSGNTLIATETGFAFFDPYATPITYVETGGPSDFVELANGVALVGNRNSPAVRVMVYENHPDTELFTYDPTYLHDEARISGDGKRVMLFSYQQFRIYDIGGELINETDIPDPEQVYDQQLIREGDSSWLEVIYNDGTVTSYNADDGSMISREQREIPDTEMYEEFHVNGLRIASPLHGTPQVYDEETGELVANLSDEDYLTYVTPVGENLVVQYVTADGYCYGQLLNGRCEVLADLPYLCDVTEDQLIFDYPTGNLRQSHIYSLQELIELGKEYQGTVGTENIKNTINEDEKAEEDA